MDKLSIEDFSEAQVKEYLEPVANYHLDQWSVVNSNDPYLAPELNPKQLRGRRKEDGQVVITSFIDAVEGNKVTTVSGSVYILLEPEKDYLEWLKENNIPFDRDNPVRIKPSKTFFPED